MKAQCIKINDNLHIQYHKTYSLGWTWSLISSKCSTYLCSASTKEKVLSYIERHYS